MKKAVDEYRQEVIDLSNSDLLSEYAAAALFVGDNRSAMVCYNMFERLSDGEKLVLGLLNLKSGDHKAARSFLRLVGDDPVAKIALSEIDIRDGHTHPAVHERLESITSSSYAANVVLGVAYYNVEEYVPSERHFKRALDMSHGSLASDRLNLMRAIVAQGRYEEVSKTMGAFYHDTHCALSPVEMEQELRRRPLEFPRLDLSPRFLYKIVKQCK